MGSISIVEINEDNVLFSDGVRLYSNGDLNEEANQRYRYCHYEVWQQPDNFGGNLAVDNLYTLEGVTMDERKRLIDRFTPNKKDVLLEVGAYHGWGTIKMAQYFKKVIAVEADEDNFITLCHNVISNGINNVMAHNYAISNQTGRKVLYKGDHPQRISLHQEPLSKVVENIDVLSTTGDLITDDATYVTLEINMGELDALRGMKDLLQKNDVRVIAAGWYGNPPIYNRIRDYLEGLGYDVFIGPVNRVYALKGY